MRDIANRKMTHKNYTIVQDLENPEVSLEILAESIIEIEKSIKKLHSTKINEKTLFKLIQMNCNCTPKPTIDMIETVILSISTMKKSFLKKISPSRA